MPKKLKSKLVKPGTKALVIIFSVLLVDQILKIWIKTNMFLGQEYLIFDWFRIHFTENEGMAFGLSFGGDYGKLLLSSFRIIAVVFIIIYLRKLIAQKVATGFVTSISLILAGAIGNIIDSAVYGMIFSDSLNQIATVLPEESYSGFLHGRVVDMLYFPLFQAYMPNWVPIFGGGYFVFFQPVFNIADSAITVGVFMIVIFQRSFFKDQESDKKKKAESAEEVDRPAEAESEEGV